MQRWCTLLETVFSMCVSNFPECFSSNPQGNSPFSCRLRKHSQRNNQTHREIHFFLSVEVKHTGKFLARVLGREVTNAFRQLECFSFWESVSTLFSGSVITCVQQRERGQRVEQASLLASDFRQRVCRYVSSLGKCFFFLIYFFGNL